MHKNPLTALKGLLDSNQRELEARGPELVGWLAPLSHGWQWTPDAAIDHNASALTFAAFTVRGQSGPADLRIDEIFETEIRRSAERILSIQNGVNASIRRIDELCVFGFYNITQHTFDWATIHIAPNTGTGERPYSTILTHRDGRTFTGHNVMSWPIADGETPRFKAEVEYGPTNPSRGLQFTFSVVERL